MKKLATTLIATLALTGCWNGVPFQVDFNSKAVVDYPEGDPRRAGGTQAPIATVSANPDTMVVSEKSDISYYADYDIPQGSLNVKASTVLLPRGIYPNTVEMKRKVTQAKLVQPETVHVELRVATAPFGATSQYIDGSWDGWGGVPGGADQTDRPMVLTVRSFDGLFERIYRNDTNTLLTLDGLPTYKPLYMKAQVGGVTGYSKPIVLAPAEKNIDGAFIPVEFNVLVQY